MISLLEPKCYCSHDLLDQRQGTIKFQDGKESEIVCQINGERTKFGSCGADEYCAGANTIEGAICGTSTLCTKKGRDGFAHILD